MFSRRKSLSAIATVGIGQFCSRSFAANPIRPMLQSDRDAGPAIRSAIAQARKQGGGLIELPPGSFFVSIQSESDILLLDSPNIEITSAKRTQIRWDHYGLPLVAILGTERCSVSSIDFLWTGNRRAPPATATLLGYDGTGIISPPDFCAHIFIGGSSHIDIHDISWRGLTPSNNLEAGISLYNGTRSGPTRIADCTHNRIAGITSSDVYFGAILSGQNKFLIDGFHSERYMVAAHVGAGHAIYIAGTSEDGLIQNVADDGIPIEEPGTRGYTAATLQLRSISRTTVRNVSSKRPDGLVALLNDSNNNIIKDLQWSADRTPYEEGLRNGNIVTIAQANRQKGTRSSISNNQFVKWNIEDQRNSLLGRSANIGIIGTSGAQFDPELCHDNLFDDLHITFSPDERFSKNVFQSYGNNNRYRINITNNGTSEKEIFRLLETSNSSSNNNFTDITLTGKNPRGRTFVPNSTNRVEVKIVR